MYYISNISHFNSVYFWQFLPNVSGHEKLTEPGGSLNSYSLTVDDLTQSMGKSYTRRPTHIQGCWT